MRRPVSPGTRIRAISGNSQSRPVARPGTHMKEILVSFPIRTACSAIMIFLFSVAVAGCRVGGDDTQTAPAKPQLTATQLQVRC